MKKAVRIKGGAGGNDRLGHFLFEGEEKTKRAGREKAMAEICLEGGGYRFEKPREKEGKTQKKLTTNTEAKSRGRGRK